MSTQGNTTRSVKQETTSPTDSLDAWLVNSNVGKKAIQQGPRRRPVGGRGATGRGGAKKPAIHYVADFETLTQDAIDYAKSQGIDDMCRVWAWGLVEIDNPVYENVEIGLDIDSFLDRIRKTNTICYFHNLRFDGIFILYWLLINNYERRPFGSEIVPRSFETMIDGVGKFYKVTIHWENGHYTEFRDSYKKIPFGLARIAESFNMDMTKGHIEYDTYRAKGQPLTAEEEDYLRRDVAIIANAMRQVYQSGALKLTVASCAMTEYKSLNTTSFFNTKFPVLNRQIDDDIREAYRGGFTYANPRFKGRIVRSGLVLDVNSLYPSIMMNRPLPFGHPEWSWDAEDGTKSHPLSVFSVTIIAKLRPGFLPCIQLKGNPLYGEVEYLKEITEPTTISVTNVDWALINEHYKVDVISWNGGWRFQAQQGMFDSYINKWSEIKANSEGGQREIAKLFLNSLYGKFASNPTIKSKVPILDPKTGAVKLVNAPSERRDPIYTPVGVFITSWARDLTIRAAQKNYKTFAYADTDSLHLLQDEPPLDLEIHPTKLGAWKLEYKFKKAFFVRSKFYLEYKGDEYAKHKDTCDEDCKIAHAYKTAVASLPVDISSTLTFDSLVDGAVLHGKLNPRNVPGGVILKDVPFEINLR